MTEDMYAHKASRGTSYRQQVIESLWMMLVFVMGVSVGALAQGRICR